VAELLVFGRWVVRVEGGKVGVGGAIFLLYFGRMVSLFGGAGGEEPNVASVSKYVRWTGLGRHARRVWHVHWRGIYWWMGSL